MDCLSDDVVHALVRGQLPRPEADACSDHISGCGRCTQAYVSASTRRLTRELHTQVCWEPPAPLPPPSLPRGAQLGHYLVLERLDRWEHAREEEVLSPPRHGRRRGPCPWSR